MKAVVWVAFAAVLVLTAQAVSPVPSWFDKKIVKAGANASNYSEVLLSVKHLRFSPVGMGYISEMDGWASWGIKQQGNKTLVRIWRLPKSAIRCVLNRETPQTFYKIWDYSNECN